MYQSTGFWYQFRITGTKSARPKFQQMLEDARAGKIDLILTKSISRFARNTVTLLETIRELKSLNVDVYFEEQRLHSISENGEMIISFLASYAQEESRSVSENMKWSIRKGFKQGLAWNTKVIGYQFNKGTFVIIPDEAKIVQEIYNLYLSGKGKLTIAKILNERGVLTKTNKQWRPSSVGYVLQNYLYTGNLLLQSTYKDSFITKQKTINDGVLPKYHVENNHEAIVDIDTFNKVQAEIKARQEVRKPQQAGNTPTIYKGLLVCGHCGKNYRRKKTKDKAYWMCATYNMLGKGHCPSQQVPEEILNEIVAKTLGIKILTNETLKKKVSSIVLSNDQSITINLINGGVVTKFWQHKSRRESWTEEMKEQARVKAKKGQNQ